MKDIIEHLVDAIENTGKAKLYEAQRYAKAQSMDFSIPASERATWRTVVSFLETQIRRY